MKAYLYTYNHIDDSIDGTYYTWKIARNEVDAFRNAFGKSKKKNQDVVCTKRGSLIKVLSVEEHEVSKIFPISSLSKEEPAKEVSDNAEWML